MPSDTTMTTGAAAAASLPAQLRALASAMRVGSERVEPEHGYYLSLYDYGNGVRCAACALSAALVGTLAPDISVATYIQRLHHNSRALTIGMDYDREVIRAALPVLDASYTGSSTTAELGYGSHRRLDSEPLSWFDAVEGLFERCLWDIPRIADWLDSEATRLQASAS